MLDTQPGNELIVGARLVVRRRGYDHHGIYAGQGRVIHYAGRIRHPQGRIEEIGLQEFSEGQPVRVRTNPGKLRGPEIVSRARSRLGECHYNLFSNNCEHFCNWCELGVSRSPQVDSLPRPLRTLLRAAENVAATVPLSKWSRAISRAAAHDAPTAAISSR